MENITSITFEIMKFIPVVLAAITAMISLINTLVKDRPYFKRKQNKLLLLDDAINQVSLEKLKEMYRDDKDREFFYQIKGIDASSKDQILWNDLYLKLNGRVSWERLKKAQSFLRYNENSISVHIRKIDRYANMYYWFLSGVLVILGLLCVLSVAVTKFDIAVYVKHFLWGIGAIAYGSAMIWILITPYNIARKIKSMTENDAEGV